MFREFRVGNGKIIQGDCLEVLKTLSENEIVLAFTSPPYLNAINYEEHIEKINGKKERWERKDISYDEYKQFLVDRFRELLRVVRPGGFNVVNISPILANQLEIEEREKVLRIIFDEFSREYCSDL